jgi:formamidopyrimidine-DNA glycosylase
MPEGPEVKTVARTLAKHLVGQSLGELWHSPHRLRREIDYSALGRLTNQTIDDVSSYGKVLFISANKKPALVAQLGMTGQLTVCNQKAPILPHTHIRWTLKNSSSELRYVDPRRFGLVDVCDEKTKQIVLNKLGPDPFSLKKSQYDALIVAIKNSTRAIKEVLLDQAVIAGVGNIYASEALFLAKIDPQRRAADLSAIEYQRLIPAIIDVMKLAYKNCGTSFSNYVDGSGKKGINIEFVKVFQKSGEPCLVCKTLIIRVKQGGRSTFYCPRCQR